MSKKSIIKLSVMAAVLLAVVLLAIFLPAENLAECGDCEGAGCDVCAGTGEVVADSMYYATFMALVPPIVAIGLALITKEVYSSLFIGIVLGALFAANYSFAGTMDAIINDALITTVADSAGI